MGTAFGPRLPIALDRPNALQSEVGTLAALGDRPVAWFRGTLGAGDAPVVARTIRAGIANGVPVVGVVERMGLDATGDVAALDGWGHAARALTAASGVVPLAVVLDGPCVGGPALVTGLFDLVVMTSRAYAFVNGPTASARTTGVDDPALSSLGDAPAHHRRSGLAHLVASDVDHALELIGEVLSFLPANNLEVGPVIATSDPLDRGSGRSAALVPADPRSSYDVRDVIVDLVDDGYFVELRAGHGPSLVVGLGAIGGMPVGIVANQPNQLAGALDIDGSLKGAWFVRWCDAFNTPLVTLVDTPGFRPGRDQEWQGIVRHGAKLAFAYAEATVPRVSLVLRKAFGGAYIVMDSKRMGNDCALAWPGAQIAVMGPEGAVEILHRKRLQSLPEAERATERARLEAAYAAVHLSPAAAAERGFIDAVIDPASTREAVGQALLALGAKRECLVARRHENVPL